MVGCGEGVVYLSSRGRPTDIGLKLGNVAGKGRGEMFLFPLFLHFDSCSSFFPVPVPVFHLLYYLFYLFSPFLWETTHNDPQWFMTFRFLTQTLSEQGSDYSKRKEFAPNEQILSF